MIYRGKLLTKQTNDKLDTTIHLTSFIFYSRLKMTRRTKVFRIKTYRVMILSRKFMTFKKN